MKKLIKFIVMAGSIIILLYRLTQILAWHTPFNDNRFNDAQHCIFENKNHEKITLNSMGHDFEVTYVKNASQECICPHFPALHITTQAVHNKWIFVDPQSKSLFIPNIRLIVELLGDNPEIDVEPSDPILRKKLLKDIEYQGHFIFKSSEKDIFSNHAEGYTLFTKNSINWTGHAWALQVDLDKKTIRCVGGVSWGFKVSWYNLWPTMILPQALTEQDWQNDWAQLSKHRHVKQYTNIQ